MMNFFDFTDVFVTIFSNFVPFWPEKFIDFVFDNEIFNYTQTVNAVYLSTNINLPNDFSLKAGTRYEHTNIEGNWENDSEDPFSKNYDNILPNLTFSKTVSAPA